ncbi:hypothetical protein VP01_3799g1 [Puccinia sorghi]|uniref:BED-type domain-containing protein n=1 Tax=Puccinia sorghi TaxID=27349 RepID=A0A0L6UTG4_9BASI|nr:hypothetical protein VP01_3799g1 [Puccinia sorghi]
MAHQECLGVSQNKLRAYGRLFKSPESQPVDSIGVAWDYWSGFMMPNLRKDDFRRSHAKCNHCQKVFNQGKLHLVFSHIKDSCPSIPPEEKLQYLSNAKNLYLNSHELLLKSLVGSNVTFTYLKNSYFQEYHLDLVRSVYKLPHLVQIIEKILPMISFEKICAILTDSPSVMLKLRKIFNKDNSHILKVHCVFHVFKLIEKKIDNHPIMDPVVKVNKTLVNYFTNAGFWCKHLTTWQKGNNFKHSLSYNSLQDMMVLHGKGLQGSSIASLFFSHLFHYHFLPQEIHHSGFLLPQIPSPSGLVAALVLVLVHVVTVTGWYVTL